MLCQQGARNEGTLRSEGDEGEGNRMNQSDLGIVEGNGHRRKMRSVMIAGDK